MHALTYVTTWAMQESGRGTHESAVGELQVDLVVCYDAHASPIRDLQRCGRTGRQRGGRVVQLLALGREELSYEKQQLACSASGRNLLHVVQNTCAKLCIYSISQAEDVSYLCGWGHLCTG